MAGLEIIQPTELYNLLNQGTQYPNLTDKNNILLLDARKKHEYSESHVITAKLAPRNEQNEFVVPYDAELECKTHVVIYDGKTENLKDESEANDCGKVMWKMGSRNAVKILKGGYEDFSALYPFLRTQKILYMPRELDEMKTYPLEVIPGFLYIGTLTQANAAYIQRELKIKGHINCCEEAETFFNEEGMFLQHIAVPDSEDSDVFSKFESACEFIDQHKERSGSVLVFSSLGISRSAAVVMAYLMHHYKWSRQKAHEHILKCCNNACPNQGFINQLLKWESHLFGGPESTTAETEPDESESKEAEPIWPTRVDAAKTEPEDSESKEAEPLWLTRVDAAKTETEELESKEAEPSTEE